MTTLGIYVEIKIQLQLNRVEYDDNEIIQKK